MQDIFLDMRRPCRGSLGNEHGDRCAVGMVLWQVYEVPHDQLLGKSFARQVGVALPGGGFRSSMSYDAMTSHAQYGAAITASVCADRLVRVGREDLDVNFIIASSLPDGFYDGVRVGCGERELVAAEGGER